jgi:hypothetical protein
MVDIYVSQNNTHWILHEKLLSTRSQFFSQIFHKKSPGGKTSLPPSTESNKTLGLPDEEDEPFRLFVGWLYSSHIPVPEQESDLSNLFDVYLMGEKWAIASLIKDVLEAVRKWYRISDTFPGLRRVQYIYANTDSESPMRKLLVGSVARMLALSDKMPAHWDKALRKNGQLAVDIILAIQGWRIGGDAVPDPRAGASKAEREKVRVVERLESEQQGKARTFDGEDAAPAKGKVDESANKEAKSNEGEKKPLTNGFNHDE